MKKHPLNVNYRTTFVIAFLVIAVMGFSLLPKSVEMKSYLASTGQVTSPLKKLAAGRSSIGSGSMSPLIFTPGNKGFNNLNNDRTADFTAILRCAEPTCVANGKIVFARFPPIEFSNSIYMMEPDGSDRTNISAASARNPRYSSDGSQIVFEKFFGAINYDLFKMNADGTSVVRLTNGGFSGGSTINNLEAAFSPDDQSIVFQSNRDGNNEIYKMNADGTDQIRLTNDPADDGSPSYSPDGMKIIFTRGTSTSQENLYVMNTDGTNQMALPTPAGSYITPSYSPDGTKIIVSYRDNQSGNHFIYIMNSDGTDFIGTSIEANTPSYSPDGRKVIFGGSSGTIQIVDAEFVGSPVILQDPENYPNFSPDWQSVIIENNVPPNRVPFDFDGDRKSDVGVFRPSENRWYISQSSDSQVTQKVFAVSGDIPTPADFDGDGKTDLAIFRPSTGNWWYLASSDNTQRTTQFGANGDIPLPSDVNGDGVDDFVLFRPTNNSWYRSTSDTATVSTVVFGASGDKPVIGDFDGDGKSDVAIYRPSTGQWWYQSSIDNSQRATTWGISTDTLVPADYDGDGITDLAVYRPSNGGWYILNSSTGQPTILGFGISTDIPIAADYDGDGKADIAVFRPSTGIWYLLQSMNGFTGLQFGVETDKPIPASFIR
jgi:Tol biopolymer transport system component